ncbi:MAG TPA: imidazole glycerol phosphate synthase subunit HisH [Symbiobacteriaceae bacterium]|jgi:glutamine amidotransferase
MTRIAIVDYNVGNLPSVQKAFAAVGYDTEVTSDPAVIAAADGLVLPGVGAFAEGMKNLVAAGLVEPVKAYAASGRPLLGICVGLQLMFEVGEEFGETPGLGLFPGRITRLPSTVKLPQIGWNLVEPELPAHPIFDGLAEPYYAYFVHSFAAEGCDPADVAALTDYGRFFPSVVARGNLIGVQFHPEKSSRAGLTMLANFGRIVCHSNSTRLSI